MEHNHDLKQRSGWINPLGKFFGCVEHNKLSKSLCEEFYPDEIGDYEQILERKKWIKCAGKRWYTSHIITGPTKKQMKTMIAWSVAWDIRLEIDGHYEQIIGSDLNNNS